MQQFKIASLFEHKSFKYSTCSLNFNFRANVILTDLNELLDLLNKNLTENKSLISSRCQIKELNWLNHENISKEFDKQRIVIIADCIYYEQVRILRET